MNPKAFRPHNLLKTITAALTGIIVELVYIAIIIIAAILISYFALQIR